MSDIVKVLRGKYALDYDEKTLDQFCNEAADEIEKLRRLVSYLAGTNTDHVRVALAGNPIVCDAIVAEARAALREKECKETES